MQIIKKITSVFLAIVFLLSSFGFSVNTTSCIETCDGTVSLIPIDDCCEKGKKDAACCEKDKPSEQKNTKELFTKNDCCKIINTTFDLSDFQTSKKNNNQLEYKIKCIDNTAVLITSIYSSEKHLINIPPPLPYGRELLSFISCLII